MRWLVRFFLVIGAGLLTLLILYRYPVSPVQEPLPRLFEVPEFELQTSEGGTLARSDLEGKIWLVDFIFTRCPGPCPVMTRVMLAIQKHLQTLHLIEAEVPLRLVSISVDPEYDSPDRLRSYARDAGADLESWFFLTGENTRQLAVQGFKVAAGKDPSQNQIPPLFHGTRLLLVDQEGWVRAIYDYLEEDLSQKVSDNLLRLRR